MVRAAAGRLGWLRPGRWAAGGLGFGAESGCVQGRRLRGPRSWGVGAGRAARQRGWRIVLRIEDLVINQNMLAQYNFSNKVNVEIMAFVRKNAERFNELSLRTIIKLAGLVKVFADNNEWEEIAEMSMMGNRIG